MLPLPTGPGVGLLAAPMLSFGGLGIVNQCAKQPRGAPWSRPRDPCLETRTLEPPRDAGVDVLFTFFGLFCTSVSNKDFRTGTKSAAPPYRSPRRRWPSPERLTARFYISNSILSSVGSRGYPTQLIPRAGIRAMERDRKPGGARSEPSRLPGSCK